MGLREKERERKVDKWVLHRVNETERGREWTSLCSKMREREKKNVERFLLGPVDRIRCSVWGGGYTYLPTYLYIVLLKREDDCVLLRESGWVCYSHIERERERERGILFLIQSEEDSYLLFDFLEQYVLIISVLLLRTKSCKTFRATPPTSVKSFTPALQSLQIRLKC